MLTAVTFGSAVAAGSVLLGVLGSLLFVGLVLIGREYLAVQRALRQLGAKYPAPVDALLVYTDSPHWQEYIEGEWLPRWGHRLVPFNRSRPWGGEQPEARVWAGVAGPREHTPAIILFRTRGEARIVRCWQAFRDYKHGNPARLRLVERELEDLLGAPGAAHQRGGE